MKLKKEKETPMQLPPIVAISSPRGTGAISIIRLSGEGVHEIAKRLVTVKETVKPKFLHYGIFSTHNAQCTTHNDCWSDFDGQFVGAATCRPLFCSEQSNGRQVADPTSIATKNRTKSLNAKKFDKHCALCDMHSALKDEVLISFFSAPNSYTGEDMVELYPHGGEFLTNEILNCFIAEGCRIAENGEFSKRAFLNGKIDLTKAEAIVDLINAQTRGEASLAFNALSGGVKDSIQVLERELIETIAKISVCVDYPEEDLEIVTKGEVFASVSKVLEKINVLISSYGQGKLLREGIRVALVGETNVGKSSLMNALLGHDRSIVTEIAGTTRDYIEEGFVINGQKFVLIDTAGIRESDDEVEKIGIERTKKMIETADIVLYIFDLIGNENKIVGGCNVQESIETKCHGDWLTDTKCPEGVEAIPCLNQSVCPRDMKWVFGCQPDTTGAVNDRPHKNTIFVQNKIDLKNEKINYRGGILPPEKDNNKIVEVLAPTSTNKNSIFRISAKTGQGIEELKKLLSQKSKQLTQPLTANHQSPTTISNPRHYQALVHAKESLTLALQNLNSFTLDYVNVDLNDALNSISSITGIRATDEVIGEIFKNFCVGK
ncbi:MAG: tRNA uridine-5-carboxymethylaminomethyl(34) synthesis GTPase MnmE [Firmicutes bacterium]|nr:tRNA uridine-5-carboxymethylaminomethyl(34) synthesis GTPase MnmE [Bacillota bacterium]